MVLANEEIAKWCHHHNIPFLSRVHGTPGDTQIRDIHAMIHPESRLQKKDIQNIEPEHIRFFLEGINDPDELYRLSRLLLPKMAKAYYSETVWRHFGLALDFYAHFTSPIRRYPDLQIHRIIKEKIRSQLTPTRIEHYKKILPKVAKACSAGERNADDTERAFDALYACRYMQDKISEKFSGRISGVSEFAIFVELENGIEVTIFLPR
jgi:ribonuclease R